MPLLQKAYLGSTPLFAEKPWFYGAEMDLINSSGVSSNQGAVATASATPHTKGAWVELIASTSAETTLLSVIVAGIGASATNTSVLIDIGTGASGSESVLIGDVAVGGANLTPNGAIPIVVPIKIASGTRISARIQGAVVSETARLSTALLSVGDGAAIPTSVDVAGGDTATSKGTALAASNTWTEIIASTSDDYSAFCLVPSFSGTGPAAVVTAYEIGVGASGSEQTFGTIPWVQLNNTEQLSVTTFFPLTLFPKEIPSGSRIAVRQSSVDTDFCATVIGIPKV